jgi:hypothetical protein
VLELLFLSRRGAVDIRQAEGRARVKAIVNVGTGGRYPEMSRSVFKACKEHGVEAELEFYTDPLPAGCPSHAEHQYMFKVWALGQAIDHGARQLLWIDCRCRPIKPLDTLWAAMEAQGCYGPQQGDAKLGQWCSDSALGLFGIDRDAAMDAPLLRGGVIGLNLDMPVGACIWSEYRRLAEAGALSGPHYNRPGQPFSRFGDKTQGHCSDDPRCGGHRHDEAVLSFLFWKFGLSPSHDLTNIESPETSLIARNL